MNLTEEDAKKLKEEYYIIKKRLDEINEKLYHRKRKCTYKTHTNTPEVIILESNANIICKTLVPHTSYLIGVKPNNCTVKFDFGGVMIPILDKEVSLQINMNLRMYCHSFYAWLTPINPKKDYSIELKFSDDLRYTSNKIRDIQNNNVLAEIIQIEGMYGVKYLAE